MDNLKDTRDYNFKKVWVYNFNKSKNIHELRDYVIKNKLYFDYIICKDSYECDVYNNCFELVFSTEAFTHSSAIYKYTASKNYIQHIRKLKLRRILK